MGDDRPQILVVDDEEQNRELLEAMLVPRGYSVLTCEDGPAALQQVELAPPDLILLDVMMPGMDGFEVARRLKGDAATRDIPVVMVTALKDVDSRVAALEAGADDFLNKPVDRSELRARVASSIKVKAFHDQRRRYRQELEAEVAQKTEQLRLAFDELESASLEVITRLSLAAEYKDDDTGAHIQRMSRYSEAVARRMGLPEDKVAGIRHAAPMHDIGKIGIPDRILLKPGKLDADEWEIMRQHSAYGAEILNRSKHSLIQLGRAIALTHHEKWDGSGYPGGLVGTDIPIAGRIVAIGDVFDALTSRRPYKEPFSLEKSYAIIREGRGTHFDPEVVDAFFDVEGELLAIKDRFQDSGFSSLVQLAGVVKDGG